MMYPPVFQTCNVADVRAVLGTSPLRIYEFGMAPQNVTVPNAVWQIVTGYPENYLDCVPDIDSMTVQIDVYAMTSSAARTAAEKLRDAIEPHAHVVSWRGENRETDTKYFRYSFDVDWWVKR
jgi:hypothetical protein